MKRLALIAITAALAGRPVVRAGLETAALDGGGGRSTGGGCVNDAGIEPVGGLAAHGASLNRAGYIGQLTDPAALTVTGTPAQVAETGTSQLGGIATMDDDTLTVLAGTEIDWSPPVWPLAGISTGGVATPAAVYADTFASVTGRILGVSGSGTLQVLDTLPDNYGSYAGDGLPDGWQVQYFGLDNPDAAPDVDLFGSGEDNLFKYVAGLDPTNPASLFQMQIEPVPGQPGQQNLVFAPRWPDRTYTPMFCSNLIGTPEWTNLLTSLVSDDGTQRTLTDTNAAARLRYYRMHIAYP